MRSASVSTFPTTAAEGDKHTLAWYCVKMLLDAIHGLSPSERDSKGKGKARDQQTVDRLHRLHLMLISTVSSLPLSLMLLALDNIRVLVTAYAPVDSIADAPAGQMATPKAELLAALFSELVEKTGDREKEAAIQWWYKYRPTLVPEPAVERGNGTRRGWFWQSKGLEKGGEPVQAAKGAGEDTQQNSVLPRLRI